MTRLILALMVWGASPALAHADLTVHFHQTDITSLILGAALIVAGTGAALFMRGRGK